MSQENLIIIPEENLSKTNFPITFERITVARNKENEAKYRHLTCLILGVYADHRIMVINKYLKNKAKYPNETFPPECRDLIGGHCVYEYLTVKELQSGEIDMDMVRSQAFREWSEEAIYEGGGNPFKETDLKFVGFYPYDSETNKELTALFVLPIPFPYKSFRTQDNVGNTNYNLPNEAISYETLLHDWEQRQEMAEEIRYEDGLGRIMEKGDLPERIAGLGLPISI